MEGDNNPHNLEIDQEDLRRRERLLQHTTAGERAHKEGYTIFIRRMRLFLPLLAVVLLVALMTWPQSKDNIVATKEEQQEQYQNVQKNELLNPKFESVDEKNQPYTITADTAIQNDDNKNLLMLTNPFGEIILNSSNKVTIAAQTAEYQQDQEKLYLKNSVRLTHDAGYEMTMNELYVDMQSGVANSETAVEGFGPQGTIQSAGLKAEQEKNLIIFTGPARLVIKDVSLMEDMSQTKNSEN